MTVDPRKTRDILIVGAGPAGAGAAYFLAKIGFDVLAVEAKKLPRAKPCGDGIGPRTVVALEKIGLGNWLETGGWHRIERLRIVAPSGAAIASAAVPELFPAKYGYVIPRADFDQKLADHAKTAGAEVIEGFHADNLIEENGRVAGVSGKYDGDNMRLRAKLTVVADGSTGPISRLFAGGAAAGRAVGLRAYAHNVTGIDDCINIYFSARFPKGYSWVFPIGKTAANVGVGLLGANQNKNGQGIKDAYRYLLNEQNLAPVSLAAATIEPGARGSIMRMNFGRRLIQRPGLVFVGDAAGLVSPINGEGISHAIESAELLAESLAAGFKDDRFLDAALSDYERRLRAKFIAYFRLGRLLDKVLAKPQRLDRLVLRAQKDDYLRIVLTGVLANTVHPRELARFKVLAKILF